MLGKRLKELRNSHNLSTVQLGERLGVTKQSVSNWENGNVQPSIEMLVKIADHFSVQTDYLLGRTDEIYLQIEGLSPEQVADVQKYISYLQKLNKALEQ